MENKRVISKEEAEVLVKEFRQQKEMAATSKERMDTIRPSLVDYTVRFGKTKESTGKRGEKLATVCRVGDFSLEISMFPVERFSRENFFKDLQEGLSDTKQFTYLTEEQREMLFVSLKSIRDANTTTSDESRFSIK